MYKNYNYMMVSNTYRPGIPLKRSSRSKIWLAFFLIFFTHFVSTRALALDLELTQGINATLPVALSTFKGHEEGKAFTQIIKADLNSSGQFNLLSADNFSTPSAASLRQAGADSWLSGQISSLGGGLYQVNFQLVDTLAEGHVLLKQDFQVKTQELRNLAHFISDKVYEKLTGERGIFSTKIAYIAVKREKGRSWHALEVADADGLNPRRLLNSTEPIMSPSWSPDGRQIAYVSFEKKKAQIFTVSVETGKRRLISDFSGINGAPAWSADGRQMALVLSKGGAPKIYTVDLTSGQLKQLTFGDSIDTEPRYSPDGRSILFTSGRGGSPQVYQLKLTDGSISRLTYEGNYNARASLTANQSQIVMLHRDDKNFHIATQDSKGKLTQLTFSGYDESPSLSPNGRMIVYATRAGEKGVLSVVSLDGRINRQLPSQSADLQEPAWSPFL